MAKGGNADHLPLPYAMAVQTSTDLSTCLSELADSKVPLKDVNYLLGQNFANAFHALSKQCTAQIEQCHDLVSQSPITLTGSSRNQTFGESQLTRYPLHFSIDNRKEQLYLKTVQAYQRS